MVRGHRYTVRPDILPLGSDAYCRGPAGRLWVAGVLRSHLTATAEHQAAVHQGADQPGVLEAVLAAGVLRSVRPDLWPLDGVSRWLAYGPGDDDGWCVTGRTGAPDVAMRALVPPDRDGYDQPGVAEALMAVWPVLIRDHHDLAR